MVHPHRIIYTMTWYLTLLQIRTVKLSCQTFTKVFESCIFGKCLRQPFPYLNFVRALEVQDSKVDFIGSLKGSQDSEAE